MKGLTPRQLEVLSFIESFIQHHHYAPSYRETMEHFGFSSIGTVYNHIKALRRKGYLTNEAHCSRSLSLTSTPPTSNEPSQINIPLIGYMESEGGIDILPQVQTIGVPRALIRDPDKTYLLRIRGDSFATELIADSDLVMVEAGTDPNPGSTVLATVHGGATFIRRYFPEGHSLRLKSILPSQEPLFVRSEDIELRGVVIAVLRLYD